MQHVGVSAAALGLTLAVCLSLLGDENAADADKPIDALVIREGAIRVGGVGKVSAVRIADREKLSALEAHFPNYRGRPASDSAGGWEAGYRVYFNFPGGETIRVTISESGNGRYWTVGRGDFWTRGDFARFVEELGL